MRNETVEISYEDVQEALLILAQEHLEQKNEVVVVEHWVKQARQQLLELEQVNEMYRMMAEIQAKSKVRS
jgi:hypothetical protein